MIIPPDGFCRRGLTLVEILVSMVVLAVIVSLLFTVFEDLRRMGQQSHCTSRLRSLTSTMLNYAMENAGTLPSRNDESNADSSLRGHWFDVLERKGHLEGYAPQNRMLYCPSGPVPTAKAHGYAYRQWEGSEVRKDYPLKLSKVDSPSTFWLFADSIQPSGGIIRQWYTIQDAGGSYAGFHLRHKGRANIAFLDGHIENADLTATRKLAAVEPRFGRVKLEIRGADGQAIED